MLKHEEDRLLDEVLNTLTEVERLINNIKPNSWCNTECMNLLSKVRDAAWEARIKLSVAYIKYTPRKAGT